MTPPAPAGGWRSARRGLAAAAAGLLLLVAAWLASNLIDSAAQPTPALLALPAPGPAVAMARELEQLSAAPLTSLQGDLLACPPTADCTARWVAGAAQLAALLQPHGELGARCLMAVDHGSFSETLPAQVALDAPFAPQIRAASECSKWLSAEAVAAAAAGDRERAQVRLRAADRFGRALLVGSQSLIGHAVAWTVARRHLQAIAAVAALQPAWVADLAPLARPFAPEALSPQRWVATEAAFQRAAMAALLRGCGLADRQWAGAIDAVVCHTGLGLLPEATRQASDAHWLVRLARFESATPVRTPAPTVWQGLAWRNTLGHWLLAVAATGYDGYRARQVDVDLHRQVLALALSLVAERIPVPARAAWLQRQNLDTATRARLRVEPGALSARSWAAELDPEATTRPIRVSLPAF